MKKIKLSLIIFIFLLSFGCIEMTREEMNTCFSLASQSFDFIPYCQSEPACYARLNNILKTDFDIPTSNKIYHLKNNVARSWFYYHKGIKEIKLISNKCLQKDVIALPGHVNQSRFYINQAFSELDKTIIKSFEIIAEEYEYLKKEEVELIKEEKIYNNYIEFKQILTELSTGSQKSKSYVSFYNEKIENFKRKNTNLPANLIEKDTIYLKILRLGTNYLLEELNLENETIEFYFLSTPYLKLMNYFELLLFKTQSLNALKQLPAHDMMLLYSDILGENNSSLEMFFVLIKEYNKNLNEVKQKRNQLWQNVDKLYNETSTLKKNSSNNEIIEFIRYNLISEKLVSNQNNEKLFLETQNTLIELRKQKFENKLTIGKELNELKNLNNSLIQLKRHYEEKNIKNNEQIFQVCDKKAKEILKLTNDKQELNKIFDDLIFVANKTLKETDLKIIFCKQTIEKEKEFNKGLADYSMLKAQYIDLTRDCFNYLDTILPKTNLNELKNIYFELKKETVTNENLFYFKDACEKIKEQVKNEINSNQNIKSLKENYLILINLQKDLFIIEKYSQKNRNTQIIQIEKEILFYEKYRTNNEFNYSLIINIVDELNQRIEKFNSNFKDYLENEKIDIIIENIIFNNISQEIIIPNVEFESTMQIIINNPFEYINKNATLKIPFSAQIQQNDLIQNYLQGEKESLIILKEIPLGQTTLLANYLNTLKISKESKILLASNKESIIQENIIILNEENFSKVLFEINTNKNTKTKIIFNDREINFVETDNKISFLLENVSNKSKIITYKYINNLITINQHIKNIKNIDETTQIIEYELLVKNNVNQKLKTNLLIPFKQDFLVKKINIYDSQFTNKQITFVGDYILLKNNDFFEFEEKQFFMIVEIENSYKYYSEQLKLLKNKIQVFDNKLSLEIEKQLTYSFSEKWIKDSIKLIDRANKILLENESHLEKEIQQELIKKELINKIEEFESILVELEKLNLISQKEKIKQEIENMKIVLEENIDDEKILIETLKKINSPKIYIEDEIKNELLLIKNDLKTNYFSDELKLISDKIISKIDFILNNPSNLNEIKNNYLKIIEDYELIKNQKTEIKIKNDEKINTIKNKIKESKKLIEKLKNELGNDSKKLLTIRFIPPITISRLDRLELELNSFKESELIKKEIEIINIYNELLMSYNDIKQQAISRFNESIDQGKSSFILTKAKEHIDNNNYILSMFALIESSEENNQIIGLMPIIIIIIIIIVIAVYSKKNSKKNKNDKDKIIESWEN